MWTRARSQQTMDFFFRVWVHLSQFVSLTLVFLLFEDWLVFFFHNRVVRINPTVSCWRRQRQRRYSYRIHNKATHNKFKWNGFKRSAWNEFFFWFMSPFAHVLTHTERKIDAHTHTHTSLVIHIAEAIARLIHKPYAKQKNMLTDCLRNKTIFDPSLTLSRLWHSAIAVYIECFARSTICWIFSKYRNRYLKQRADSIQFNRKILNESVSFSSPCVFYPDNDELSGLFFPFSFLTSNHFVNIVLFRLLYFFLFI